MSEGGRFDPRDPEATPPGGQGQPAESPGAPGAPGTPASAAPGELASLVNPGSSTQPGGWQAGSAPDPGGSQPAGSAPDPGGWQPAGSTTPPDALTPPPAVTPPVGWAPLGAAPGTPGAPPAAPEKKGIPFGGWILRIGVIAAIVIAGLVLRDRLSGNAVDLKVGDCFDDPGEQVEVSDVQHQPCTDPHDSEVMFVADYPNQDTYPGNDAFDVFTEQQCIPAFESYVGRDYETDTEFEIGIFYPLSQGWSRGDHEITCYVFRLDGGKMTASVKV